MVIFYVEDWVLSTNYPELMLKPTYQHKIPRSMLVLMFIVLWMMQALIKQLFRGSVGLILQFFWDK